jgi:hypothetical protein
MLVATFVLTLCWKNFRDSRYLNPPPWGRVAALARGGARAKSAVVMICSRHIGEDIYVSFK